MSLILDGTNGLSDVDGTAATPAIRGTDANTGIFFPAADTIAFSEGGVESMRLDSSGQLGIGTTNPQSRLTVGSVSAGTGEATNKGLIQIQSNGGASAVGGGGLEFKAASSTAGFGFQIASPDLGAGNVPLVFCSRNDSATWTERMRIASDGALFVGVTSQIGPARVVTSQSTNGFAAFACNHTLGAGQSLIAFANAANNLLIGNIVNNGNTGVVYNTISDYRLKENIQPMTGALAKVALLKPVTYKWKVDGSDGQGFIAHELQEVVPYCVTGEKDAVNEDGSIKAQGIDTSFLVATLTAAIQELKATVDTQTVKFDTSGNLGIGTTRPSEKLHVSGGLLVTDGIKSNNNLNLQKSTLNSVFFTDALSFAQSGTAERMRIDSMGNLLVGADRGFSHRFVKNNGGAFAVEVTNSALSHPFGLNIRYSAASPNNVLSNGIVFQDSTAPRFIVRSNGGIANFSANNTSLSDRREKINFAPAKPYLETICAIPVQTFNYIDQNMESDPGLTLGVAAQDVQAVAPELVMESNWAKEGEEPKMRLSIYQTDMQYALMKCIQELKATVDAQAARIAALEELKALKP